MVISSILECVYWAMQMRQGYKARVVDFNIRHKYLRNDILPKATLPRRPPPAKYTAKVER